MRRCEVSKSNKTIEEMRAELDELLQWFEGDQFVLEQAMAKFEEANKLASTIEAELTEYKNSITVLKKRFDQEDA